MFLEYIKILFFLIIAVFIVTVLIYIPRYLNKKFFWKNTFKPVECGSQSFGSGKNRIEIIFYRVLIVFIIFEVEIIVLVPWIFNFNLALDFSTVPMVLFFLILFLGYVYEFSRGVFKF